MKKLVSAGVIASGLGIGSAALAEVPWHSLFPRTRPAHVGNHVDAPAVAVAPDANRPQTDDAVAQALGLGTQSDPPGSPAVSGIDTGTGLARSLLPRPRPPAAAARFAAGSMSPARPASGATASSRSRAISEAGPVRRGICGSRALEGQQMPLIRSASGACGIAEPVSVTAIQGIALSRPATLDCQMARALADWVDESLVPAVGRRGGGVAEISVIGHYACRTRNSQPGARISEHARGMAIDIAGYRLNNGDLVQVEDSWRSGRDRRDLREMYEEACGTFRTTLGPDADQYHQDHFHFDLASHRSGGSYCR